MSMRRLRDLLLSRRRRDTLQFRPFQEFSGDWAAAEAAAGGYGASEILDRVLTASLAVENGSAVHERDSVTFDRIEYSWPVLASLLWSAACHAGRLRVLDMGGSLGTTYRQNRRFIGRIPEVSWAVVEQPSFVAAGKTHFEDGRLSFHDSIGSATSTAPHVALLGSSLQYLEHPKRALDEITNSGIDMLIIDRTPLHSGTSDVLTLQHVPPHIYPAVYPAWILSRPRLEATLEHHWDLVEEFAAPEGSSVTAAARPFTWSGMVFRRRLSPTNG
jgi:putative methyltransferase (TIGR04325 family)